MSLRFEGKAPGHMGSPQPKCLEAHEGTPGEREGTREGGGVGIKYQT